MRICRVSRGVDSRSIYVKTIWIKRQSRRRTTPRGKPGLANERRRRILLILVKPNVHVGINPLLLF
jgi:hypothetical protein